MAKAAKVLSRDECEAVLQQLVRPGWFVSCLAVKTCQLQQLARLAVPLANATCMPASPPHKFVAHMLPLCAQGTWRLHSWSCRRCCWACCASTLASRQVCFHFDSVLALVHNCLLTGPAC